MTELSPDELRRWTREHSGRLLALLQSFADGPTEAEDLLQETWVVVLANAHKRQEDTSERAWLYQVALNVGRQHARRRRRRRGLLDRWATDRGEPTTGHAPSLEEGQLHSRIWQAVAELPTRYQQVLLRRILEDMSTAETARDIQVTEGSVKTTLHRATRALRKKLGDDWRQAMDSRSRRGR